MIAQLNDFTFFGGKFAINGSLSVQVKTKDEGWFQFSIIAIMGGYVSTEGGSDCGIGIAICGIGWVSIPVLNCQPTIFISSILSHIFDHWGDLASIIIACLTGDGAKDIEILSSFIGGGANLDSEGRIFSVWVERNIVIEVNIITDIWSINPSIDSRFVAIQIEIL